MAATVFFSWQADTPNDVGRNFIVRALERAVGRISSDMGLEEASREVQVDHDTKDVSGSPPIVDTILAKIDSAALFVADLTFVAPRLDGQRQTPNPNVLIEYGWALRSLGHSRVLAVMNAAYGPPTDHSLPFNLRHLRRPLTYDLAAGADIATRQQVREGLAKELEGAIRSILSSEDYLGTLPKPAAPRPFVARLAHDGSARFRERGRPIGLSGGHPLPEKEVTLTAGPAIWLRVMPRDDAGREWKVAELRQHAWEGGPIIHPLDYQSGGLYRVRSDDGYGTYTPVAHAYEAAQVTFVFRSGEIWGIDGDYMSRTVVNGIRYIPNVESLLQESLKQYGDFLSRLGEPGPYVWVAGMEDTNDRILYSHQYVLPGAGARCAAPEIVHSGTYSLTDDPVESLSPFFAALFDACGVEWIGPQR